LKTSLSWGQLDPNKLTHFSELDGTMIHDVISDRMGVLWIATQSGLVKFDGNDYTRFHPDINDTTTMGTILTFRLYEDPKGNIWIGCMDNIYKYNPDTKSFKSYNFSSLTEFPKYGQSSVYSISPDNQGRIYFGLGSFIGAEGNHSMVYYNEQDDQLKQFEYPDSLDLKNIYKSTTDAVGNIWGISLSGVFKIDTNHILSFIPEINEFNFEGDEFTNGIISDSNSLLWRTTNQAKLISFNHITKEINTWPMDHLFEEEDSQDYPIDIEVDQNQNLWLSSHQGLICFNRKKEQFEIFENGKTDRLKSDEINSLHFDSFNNLWIATQSVGLLKYNDRALLNSIVHNVNEKNGMTSGWAVKILESSDGTVWIGTPSGMNAFDPNTGALTPYPCLSIAPDLYTINLIAEIHPGELLLESNLGRVIFLTETQSIKQISLQEVPDSVSIHNVVTDNFGNTWYATNNGLYLIEKRNSLIRHLDLSKKKGSTTASNLVTNLYNSTKYGLWIQSNNGLFLYNYKSNQIERHGLSSEQGYAFTSHDINSFYEDPEGIIWIGTWQGGLCKYNPESGRIKNYSISDGLPSTSIQSILGDAKNNALWLSTFAGISRFSIAEEQFNNYSLADGIQGLLYTDGSYLKTSNGMFFFGGNNGITYFNSDEVSQGSAPPKVYITDFKVADHSIGLITDIINATPQSEIHELTHDQNNVSFDYVGIQYDNPAKNRFSYKLESYDDSWREVGTQRSAFYYNLPPGNYIFRVKAANSNGVWNETGISLSFKINPPWWKTWWAYLLYGLILIAGIFAIDRIQRRRLVEKASKQAKEKELEQAREIEKAYNKLKKTQTQLLHSEKMASLGELTAGIAHEIQNPLNFVNNFSDVSVDLIEEMDEEIEQGNTKEVKSIAEDLKQNLEKIHHHGERASSIVRGMLEHSRSGNDKRQPTNINAMAEEYIRLAYHGIRAKDKSFNADFKANLDENLPKINVVGQEIARVVLNLINNAFFAVSAKASATANPNYKPLVTISTKKINGQVEIRVKDNGMGIPTNIIDKIFQPFFTTKPSGEGTGLGLSLSYDIITKGHGGELRVETKEGEGSCFVINLPIQ